MRAFLCFVLLLSCSAALGQTSRRGEFFTRITIKAGAKDQREHNTWTALILDKSGTTRFRIEKEIGFDVQYPAIYLADNGAAIVVSVFDGVIEHFNPRGTLVKTVMPFGRKTAEYEQIIKCSVSGDRAAFLISSPDWQHAALILATVRGDELWRRSLEYNNAAEVALSSDGVSVAAGSYAMQSSLNAVSQIFGADGRLLGAFDGVFRTADFSSDGHIVLADRNSVRLCSLSEAKPMFVWVTAGRECIVTSVAIVHNHVAAVVENVATDRGLPTYTSPTAYVLDRNGTVKKQVALQTSTNFPATLTLLDNTVVLTAGSSNATILLSELK